MPRANDIAVDPDAKPLHGDSRLGDLLWEVSTHVELMGEAELADIGLTLPANGMLNAVMAEPGITVAEISRRIPRSQQAIGQVVNRLERLGLIERRLGSGRGVGLFATDEGRRLGTEGTAREDVVEIRLRELLGAERYEALIALLSEGRAALRSAR